MANYQFVDALPSANVSTYYYRLKMVDKTGNAVYSKAVSVLLSVDRLPIKVAPNPFKGSLALAIDALENTNASIMITSIGGKVLVNKKYALIQGSNTLQVNETNRLAKGFYLITIKMGYTKKTLSIEKE